MKFENGGMQYVAPKGVARKELTRLQKAFAKVFTKYPMELIAEDQPEPNPNKDATAFYSIPLPAEITKLPNKASVQQRSEGYLWLSTQVNPCGITGPDDIGRTYTIHAEFVGGVREYRCKHWDDRAYAKAYSYGRTVEEAIEDFKEEWADKIAYAFGLKDKEIS